MVKNLDLDLSTAVTLDSTTSDLSAGRTWTPQNDTQTAVGIAWAQNGGNVARSMDPGNIYFSDGVGTGTADGSNNLQGTTSGEPWEFIGNYYNWYAATAGSGTVAMANGNAPDSICPRGWRLPDNTGSKSFTNLINTIYGITSDTTGASKLLQSPLNFVRSGDYYWAWAIVQYKGANGHWWQSTAQSTASAYYLGTSNSGVGTQSYHDKGYGFSVRCVAR